MWGWGIPAASVEIGKRAKASEVPRLGDRQMWGEFLLRLVVRCSPLGCSTKCQTLIDSWSCGLRFLEAMGFKPLVWYCQPEKNGAWAKVVENAFGAYTPCGMESLVVCISHLALFGVCFYRIWKTMRDLTVRRYCLRSPYYNYLLGLVAAYCTAEPLFRMIMGLSITNLDGHTALERRDKRRGRKEQRGGREEDRILTGCRKEMQPAREMLGKGFLFGILLLLYVPSLDPYPGYTPIRTESLIDDMDYEPLPGEEQICPERKVNILSKHCHGLLTKGVQELACTCVVTLETGEVSPLGFFSVKP
ncbi:hypothetical protein BHE74_00031170 [Ensete ventricosum]|nr:hypothetical protein BHE74_00031170 [Ensete ventricosum]